MAFPTTGILDNFNRANEGPPPSANWTTLGSYGLKVVNNVCVGNTASQYNAGYWSAQAFGPDSEVYAKVPNIANYLDVLARLDAAQNNGYLLHMQSTTVLQVFRVDSGATTQIGSNITLGTALVAGDQVGMEITGDEIKVYTKQGGGAWTQRGSTITDSTYGDAGYIGARVYSTTQQIDDFGGGTVVAEGFAVKGRRGLTVRVGSRFHHGEARKRIFPEIEMRKAA